MKRHAFLLLWLAASVQAEPARLMSGEHADFTRLVVELPAPSRWVLGRTQIGYAFAAPGSALSGYDLTRVWDRIPRTRLLALRTEPENDALFLTLACACHVIAFEYRPGMVVLDIRDGPAPSNSEFEAPFQLEDPEPAGENATLSLRRNDVEGYSWIDLPPDGASPAFAGPPMTLPPHVASLDILRDALLLQISRGAAAGIVEMQLPEDPDIHQPVAADSFPWSQIRIGEPPGLAVAIPEADDEGLPPAAACIPDDRLAVPAWGSDAPALAQLAAARSGLFGEFDRIESAAVQAAVRVHIFLGFGAEAAQFAALLEGPDIAEEVAIYESLARLVDGEADPGSTFRDMLGCNGRAAFWAALAAEGLPLQGQMDRDAVLRSFQELPPHLQRSLGPPLARKFLDGGHVEAARIIRDGLARASGSTKAEVALLDAKAALDAGDPELARAEAARALEEGQWQPDALIALVKAHARDSHPLPPDIAAALLAFSRDAPGDADKTQILEAAVVALALSGQIDQGFSLAAQHGLSVTDLWDITTLRASDDTFLRHAILSAGGAVPEVHPETALSTAERLLELGFAQSAFAWLGPVVVDSPARQRRLAARAALETGAAKSALEHLADLSDPADHELRARAFVQLGQLEEARAAFLAAGLAEEADRVSIWQGDWDTPSERPDGAWRDASARLVPEPPDPAAGPLARGLALIDDSAAARAAIEALLSEVPGPDR